MQSFCIRSSVDFLHPQRTFQEKRMQRMEFSARWISDRQHIKPVRHEVRHFLRMEAPNIKCIPMHKTFLDVHFHS